MTAVMHPPVGGSAGRDDGREGERDEREELAQQLARRLVGGMRQQSLVQLKFALAMLEVGATGTLVTKMVDPRLVECMFFQDAEGAEFSYGFNSVDTRPKRSAAPQQPSRQRPSSDKGRGRPS